MKTTNKQEFAFKLILLALCLCFIAVHYSTLLFTPYIQRDVGLHLTSGKMILEGCRPYVELIDTNPPFAMYLSVIPAAIAKFANIRLITSGYLFYMLLEIFSCFLFVYIISKTDYLTTWLDGLVLVCFFLFASHWAYSLRAFGQREHFIAIFLSVFSMYRYSIYNGVLFSRFEKVLFSSLAFCMLAMKLHFLLLIIAGEIMLAIKFKFTRKHYFPDIFVFLILGIVYLSHFYMIPRMSEFYTYWIGFISKGYSAFNISISDILVTIYKERFVFILMFFLNFLFVFPWLLSKGKKFTMAVYFAILANISIIIFLIQSKGWLYHLLPFLIFSIIGWYFLTKGISTYLSSDYSYVMQIVVMLCFIFFFYSSDNVFGNNRLKPLLRFSDYDFQTVIEKFSTINDKLMFIDVLVCPTFPALTYSGRSNASSLLSGFPLVFIFKNAKNYEISDLYKNDEAKYFAGLIEDISKNKPKIIFIRNRNKLPVMPEYFNPTEYLKRRKFFPTIKNTYRKIASGSGFDMFLRLDKL